MQHIGNLIISHPEVLYIVSLHRALRLTLGCVHAVHVIHCPQYMVLLVFQIEKKVFQYLEIVDVIMPDSTYIVTTPFACVQNREKGIPVSRDH
jgi:hypothetical protein